MQNVLKPACCHFIVYCERSKRFQNSHVLFTNINRFESWKFLQVTFFGTHNTLPSLSHIQNIVLWNMTF